MPRSSLVISAFVATALIAQLASHGQAIASPAREAVSEGVPAASPAVRVQMSGYSSAARTLARRSPNLMA